MTPIDAEQQYKSRIEFERKFFQDNTHVHGDLPAIFHYWSNKWIRPKLEVFGFSHPDQFFETFLRKHCVASAGKKQVFASIGSGNCDTEVQFVAALVKEGHTNLVMECVDLNPDMLERGRALAQQMGVAAQMEFTEADFNQWRATRTYDVVMANQSLHHVVGLEHLFSEIHGALAPDGHLVTADMIGRNGHLRWPESLEIIHEYWRELPASYRHNLPLQRDEELYENWDCSLEGFEGIRAQDILPLLLAQFHCELFIGFCNVIAPFVDRAFGPNYNPDVAWDRDFIDRVHLRDELEMRLGRIKPTQMLAVFGKNRSAPQQYLAPLSPEFSVRWPDQQPSPEPPQKDLQPFTDAQSKVMELTGENHQLKAQLEQATRQIQQAGGSKWVRLGRCLGLGPKLR